MLQILHPYGNKDTDDYCPGCYANVTYMNEMTPRVGDREHMYRLNQLRPACHGYYDDVCILIGLRAIQDLLL